MGGLSLGHWLILAIILLVFFGPNKLSDVAKSLGKGVRGFKEGLSEIDVEAKELPSHQEQQATQQTERPDLSNQKEKAENKKS